MNWADRVTNLQFDLSSHCNARCFMCIRNQDGGDKIPDLPLDHFDIDIWNRIAEYDTRGWTIHDLTLNGNWGDPIMHKDLNRMMLTWAKFHPETGLYLHTNGSLRSTNWWADFAYTCRQFSDHRVIIAVDGLADTHAIYRQDTDFHKIKENVIAFTEAGGVAEIVTTMFEHNKHQIDDIVAEVETWGTRCFQMRHSHNEEIGPIKAYRGRPEFRKNFRSFNRSDLRNADEYNKMRPDYWDDVDNKLTHCPWYNLASVQIDPWGNVWPCCHISLLRMHKYDKETEDLNLKDNNLHDVLDGHWYSEVLKDGINGTNDTPRWEICDRKCGTI